MGEVRDFPVHATKREQLFNKVLEQGFMLDRYATALLEELEHFEEVREEFHQALGRLSEPDRELVRELTASMKLAEVVLVQRFREDLERAAIAQVADSYAV